MHCDTATTLIAELLGGELPAAQRPALEEHLAGCADCRALAEQAGAGLGLLREAFPPVPARARPRVALRALRYAAVFLFAFAAGWLLRAPEPPADPPPPPPARAAANLAEALHQAHRPERDELAVGLSAILRIETR